MAAEGISFWFMYTDITFRQNTTGVEIICFGISVGKEFEVFSVLKHNMLKITHKE